jgi:hypothetical protein
LLFQFGGPFAGFDAVKKDEIDVVGVDFLEETLDADVGIGTIGFGNTARPESDFGDDGEFFARNVFER